MPQHNNNVLIVLSGGQDSTTCAFWAKRNFPGCNLHAITFDYGQRHSIEIEAASNVAKLVGCASHEIIQVPNCLVSASPLTSSAELETYANAEQMEQVIGNRIEKTFVPMRNTLFLTIAMNRAVAMGSHYIVTGICQEDNANYPDCTEEFRTYLEISFNQSLGLKKCANIEDLYKQEWYHIVAPLMFLSKASTAKIAAMTGGCMGALAYSHTSYDGKYPPTDMNHSNVLRAKGFEEAGIPDPLVLRANAEGLMLLPDTSNYTTESLNAKVMLEIQAAKEFLETWAEAELYCLADPRQVLQGSYNQDNQ